jgi:hypothetical protein
MSLILFCFGCSAGVFGVAIDQFDVNSNVETSRLKFMRLFVNLLCVSGLLLIVTAPVVLACEPETLKLIESALSEQCSVQAQAPKK